MSYRHFATTSGDELWTLLDAAHDRFAATVRRAGSAGPVRRSAWTPTGVAAHVLSVVHRYTRRDLRSRDGRFGGAAEMRSANDDQVVDLAHRPVDDVLAEIGGELDRLRSILPPAADLDERLPFHSGIEVDAAGHLGNLVGEFVVHAWDIAVARGDRFPIDERTALVVGNALVQTGPGFVDRDAPPVRAAIRARGAVPWLLDFGSSGLESRPLRAGESVDVAVRAPIATMVLAFYGRYTLVESARHGMLVTGGRRPWRAVRLTGATDVP